MPLVSVILNSYNQAPYLADAVESVLGQTFADFELIVLDNGSTDDSPRVLRRYDQHPKVRLFLHEDNAAITRRFNQGVAQAQGEFVSFLYSDDYYLPTKLERQTARFAELPPDYGVVYGPGQGFNAVTGRRWTYGSIAASGKVLKEMFLKHEQGQIDMISPLIRRSCLLRYPFYEDVFAEGEGIFFRIAMTARFAYINEPLAVIRDHMSNAGKAIKRNAEMTMVMLDRLAAHPDFPPDQRRHLDRYRSMLHRNYGWQMIRVGKDVAWARSSFYRAIRTGRREALHPRLIAGLGLALLPMALRSLLNRVGDAVRRLPANSVYVDDFGGSIGRV